jgi:16S rRNA (cytidine1402-2'-O)-methyltransferase
MADGLILLAATPIGDPADASPRLREALAQADLIAAEDTRRLRRLLDVLGLQVTARIISHHEHNEQARAEVLVAEAAGGAKVVVVTDAGMPGISDPGLRVVQAARDAGVPVKVVPGPSAVLAALAVSGLATDRFCFEGFPPRTSGALRQSLDELVDQPRTMVFFESPRRLGRTLAVMAEVLGPGREAAVCRELTKTYEEVRRGGLGELATWAGDHEILGEITLVVAGATRRERGVGVVGADQVAAVRRAVAGGLRLKDAVAAVSVSEHVSKRALYDAVVKTS